MLDLRCCDNMELMREFPDKHFDLAIVDPPYKIASRQKKGSGSIAIACHDYGFDLTACELDKDYYEAAMKRINAHVAQQKLFI